MYIEHKNVFLHGTRSGNGSCILMIHGACTHGIFFQRLANVLSKDHTVLYYDRRGYGKSSSSSDEGIQAHASDAAFLIQSVFHRPCFLIAHSAGCVPAMELIRQHPDLVKGVLLHEPFVPSEVHSQDEPDYEYIRRMIDEKKYTRALYRFLPCIGSEDPEALPQTEEESSCFERDCMAYIMHEFMEDYAYQPDYPALKNTALYVGCGRLSKGSFRHNQSSAFVEKSNAEMISFPGAHNGFRDHPDQCAEIIERIIHACSDADSFRKK